MKCYYKAPEESVMMVKPDRESEEYEFYLIKPILLGHAAKVGDRKVAVGRHIFSTLKDAVMHLLEGRGEKALADKIQTWKEKDTQLAVTGLRLVKSGDWVKYCALHKIPETEFLSTPDKTYLLSPKDIKKFGLRGTE